MRKAQILMNKLGLMKDTLCGKNHKRICWIKSKNNNDEDEKGKGTKKCVIKRKPKFQDYKICLEAAQIENKINNLEKIKLMLIVLKDS